jgi:hypothetical protein
MRRRLAHSLETSWHAQRGLHNVAGQMAAHTHSTTTLILVKGAEDARGSKLMPDKKDFGYSFPCDDPGRGGTCDISACVGCLLSC